jgi:hypothetical protein
MPRYAALIYSEEPTSPPSDEQMGQVMAEYVEFGEASRTAGVNLGGEALYDTNTATTVRVEGGKGGEVITTDGPFAETKEALGGFYLLQASDLDDAIKWASQIPGAWHGRVEVRPIMEFEEGE